MVAVSPERPATNYLDEFYLDATVSFARWQGQQNAN
jgi:hypothetical protein